MDHLVAPRVRETSEDNAAGAVSVEVARATVL
jgi:hypothetical protein